LRRLALTGAVLVVAVAACATATAAPRESPAPVDRPLKLEAVGERQSFGASFVRYRQTLGGLPVLGSDSVVTDGRGRSGDLVVAGPRRARQAPPRATLARADAIAAARRAVGARALRAPVTARLAVLAAPGAPRVVWRVVVPSSRPLGSFEILVDARDANVLRTRDLLRRAFTASGLGAVFDTNPIAAQGSRAGLADAGDADSATLTALREDVTLARLETESPGCLEGRWAHVTVPAGEVCDDPGRDFRDLTRADAGFEAVMGYFHVDRAQEYIRSLGFANVRADQQRVLANELFLDGDDDPLPPDEQDNSYYDPATGEIALGTGGVDDGEDGEVIVHEYGHAIQDDQVPGWGAGNEGGAMGEGFGDYLAAAIAASFAPSAAFDPCVAEWDALGFGDPAPVPCLRRVDGELSAAAVGSGTDCDGEVHCAGEAWSGALWAIRATIGATTADRLVLQSHFSLTPSAGFQDGALALLAADQALYGGVHAAYLRDLLVARGLLDIERFDDSPSGAQPLALPGGVTGTLAAGDDDHDVYALPLTAGRSVLLRLTGSDGEYDLRLLGPAALGVDDPAALVAASEAAGSNETLSFAASESGVHFVDVVAIVGAGPYELTARLDADADLVDDDRDNCAAIANNAQGDRDGDGAGDACDRFPDDPGNDRDGDGLAASADNCPEVANRPQRDWDGDGSGDRCDRSARVTLGRVRRAGRRVDVVAKLRPDLLGARAVRLSVSRRACAARCRWRRVPVRVAARDLAGGRVRLRLRLGGGRHRLRARLADDRYVRAHSRPVAVPRR